MPNRVAGRIALPSPLTCGSASGGSIKPTRERVGKILTLATQGTTDTLVKVSQTCTQKELSWKSRDAWLCVLVLVLCELVLSLWLRIGVRRSPAFSEWLKTPLGLALTVMLQGGMFMLLALWFSWQSSIRDFVKHIGLRQRVSLSGWCAAWLALGFSLN